MDLEIPGDRKGKNMRVQVISRESSFYWFESLLRRPEIISLLDTQVDGTFSAMNALKGYRKVMKNNSKSTINYSELSTQGYHGPSDSAFSFGDS